MKGVDILGLLDRFRNKNPTAERITMVTERGNGFYAWNGKIYESDIVRSCIRPFAKGCGKLTPKHLRKTGDAIKVNPDINIKFLLEEPNPLMTMQVFIEKMATQFRLNNNAFAYINKDENGIPIEIYPITCTMAECIYANDGELFLRFNMLNGKIITLPYANVLHLRQDFNENDVFGTSNAKALASLMSVVTTTDQGIVSAIKNSAVIRWLLKFNVSLKPKDLEEQTKQFTDSFLDVSKSVGAAATDTRFDATQVTPQNYVPNSSQMDKTTIRLYNFFNTNEKIIQSKYSEDDWNAYYESEIEPFAMQLSSEHIRKSFTRKQRITDRIVYSANNLQYASMNTKVNLLQMVDRGALTPNEWREVLNMPPIEGGDKPIRRLDTAVVTNKLDALESKIKALEGGATNA
jgi:HK97 family phage portal protein